MLFFFFLIGLIFFQGFHLNQFGLINWAFLWSHILAICNNGCVNGRCTRPNVCTCNQGYRGSTCREGLLVKVFVFSWDAHKSVNKDQVL